MILPIITIPNPILREKARKIGPEEIKSSTIKKLIFDMKETVVPAGGVGLAAPQVGFSVRLIVIAIENKITALINPEIIKFSWRTEVDEEGCLSVPGKFGSVRRAKSIIVEALDENGTPLKFRAEKFFARVIQHEVDHLDGILFTDKAKKIIKESASRI